MNRNGAENAKKFIFLNQTTKIICFSQRPLRLRAFALKKHAKKDRTMSGLFSPVC